MADEVESPLDTPGGEGESSPVPPDVMREDLAPIVALPPAEESASNSILEAFERLASRQDQLEQDLAAALERESRYSRLDHGHPHDASTQSLIDALGEIDREEQSPVRKHWYEHKLFGGD